MESEKKYIGGWWMWVLLLLVVTIVVFGGLRYAGIVGSTVIEREVFERSFQYSEARKSEIATFEAQLAAINRRLSTGLVSGATRANLEAQEAALLIQLDTARGKQ